MAYTKPQTIDATPGGDTVKEAIVDKVDANITQIFSDLNTHEGLTATHGATGAVVGTTNTQTLTNKTLTSPTITGTGAIAGTFTGNITGNVTGNCSGTAAKVTGAAQTAITSLGTLTALAVDNIRIDGNTISSTAGTDLNITPLAGQQIVLDGTIVVDAGVVTGATSITSGQLNVDNIRIDGNTISSTAGTDLNITPLAGQQIVLDGAIEVDAGVMTGATSITSTKFVGALTGDVTGNASTATSVVVGSDADGDMYYRASSLLARLAKGTANFNMFMNAAGTAPEWASGYKIGTLTRNMDAATADVAYTGVGFKPSFVAFLSQSTSGSSSVGFDDGTLHYCIQIWGTAVPLYANSTSYSIMMTEAVGKLQTAIIKTLDADGFTLKWTRTGATASATGTIFYMAFR